MEKYGSYVGLALLFIWMLAFLFVFQFSEPMRTISVAIVAGCGIAVFFFVNDLETKSKKESDD